MFLGLLSAFITERFGESLASNSKGCIKCLSLNNRPCQGRPTLININSNVFFIHLLAVLINVVEVVILLMIHMLEYVFQMKQKI